MRITTIALLALALFIGCENPGETANEQRLYQGQTILTEKAPFLINTNSLSKTPGAILVIDDAVAEGTVYGLETETNVYAAEGGEVLPVGTWVDNLDAEPIEVNLGSGLIISFAEPTTVTIIDAEELIYIDSNGEEVLFSGSGVITTSEIHTGDEDSDALGKTSTQSGVPTTTLISSVKFAIGGEGGDAA